MLAKRPREVKSRPALPGWSCPCLALGPCCHWLPTPLGAETRWLLGAEEELRWAGGGAWLAHFSGDFHVEIYGDQETKALASRAVFWWPSLEA